MQMRVVKKIYREFRAIKRYNDRMRALLSDSGTMSQSAQSPRFVLFGSPEYNNLGDHAICYAMLEFLKAHFPQTEILEIPETTVLNSLAVAVS